MVVDMQEGYLPWDKVLSHYHADGRVEFSAEYSERRKKLIENIREKIRECIDYKQGIVLVNTVQSWPIIDIISRTCKWYEKVVILNKHWYSSLDWPMWNLKLLRPLKNAHIKIVWVEATICVRETAVDLHREWFNVSVLPKLILNKFTNFCLSSKWVEIEKILTLDEFLRDNSFEYIIEKYGDFKHLLDLNWYDEKKHKYIWTSLKG
jgi:hypothetical protein